MLGKSDKLLVELYMSAKLDDTYKGLISIKRGIISQLHTDGSYGSHTDNGMPKSFSDCNNHSDYLSHLHGDTGIGVHFPV